MLNFDEHGMTFVDISEYHDTSFHNLISKINRKAKKYNLEPLTVDLVDFFNEVVTNGNQKAEVRVNRYIVSNPIPKINGWVLASRFVDEDGDGKVIVKKFRDIDFDFENIDVRNCDHCHTRRARKSGYILENEETGELIQIGNTCAKDFLGTIDPKAFEIWFGINRTEFPTWNPAEPGVPTYAWGYDVKDMVSIAYDYITTCGYVKKNDPVRTPTAEHMHLYPRSSNHEKAEEIIDWFSKLDYDKNNDWLYNCVTVMAKNTSNRLALIASAVNYFIEQNKPAVVGNSHVGTIGERHEFTFTVEHVVVKDGFDVAYPYIMYFGHDEDGNKINIKSSRRLDMVAGQEYTIIGTIKSHSEHEKFGKSTWLNRVKVKNG